MIVFLVAAAVIIYFGTQALTAPQDEKIGAFSASITDEANGNYTEAVNKLMKIYDANKNNYLINMRLGWLHYLKESYDISKKYYKNAISLTQEKSIEPYLGLTLPLAALKEWSEVKNTYEKILLLDPNNYTANLRLGQIYLNNKDYRNAKLCLEKAYLNYKAEFEVNHSLGWTYFYLGDKKKANELFTNALMLNSKDALASQGYELSR